MAKKIRGNAVAQRQYEDDGGEISYAFDQLATDPIGEAFEEQPAVLVLTDERVFTESEVRAMVNAMIADAKYKQEWSAIDTIVDVVHRNGIVLDPA